MTHIRIAVVQFRSQPHSPLDNVAHVEEFMRKATGKADVIVFPENFLTGSVRGIYNYASQTDDLLLRLSHLAKNYSMDIVAGSLMEQEEDRYYNTCYYIDRSGEITGKYRKVNLWYSERHAVTPGDKAVVFPTRFGRVGLTVCWDLFYPDIFREMLQQQVEIVYCTSAWLFTETSEQRQEMLAEINQKYPFISEIDLVNLLCPVRAFENGIVLVYTNIGRRIWTPWQKQGTFGRSQIALPLRGCIHRLNHAREEMFIEDIDLDILKAAERVYEVRKDLTAKGVLVAPQATS